MGKHLFTEEELAELRRADEAVDAEFTLTREYMAKRRQRRDLA